MRTHGRDKRFSTQFQSVMLKLKTGYLMKQCTKSGIKNHLRSSKCDINPPTQKLQDTASQSSQIFKWQNQLVTAFLELQKYQEIANFLQGIKFNQVKK